MFKIGEFAKLGSVSVKALRHYHRLDLLVPVYVDRFSGYRYYKPDQLQDLQIILYLRSLGLSLAQVGEVVHAADAAELQHLLLLREDELMQELSSLKYQLRKVQAALEAIDNDDVLPVPELPMPWPMISPNPLLPEEIAKMNVKIEQRSTKKFVALKRTFNMEEQEQENRIPAMWDEFFMTYYEGIKPLISTPSDAYGLCSAMDTSGNFDYLVAYELVGDDDVKLPEGLVIHEVPELTYVVIAAPGPADSIGKAYDYAFKTWFPQSETYEHDQKQSDFELYPHDEFKGFEEESMCYVYIPIKKK